MPKKLLIELQYLGNIAYYRHLLQFDEVWIEEQENFQKASFRNRCEIATPEGKKALSVFVKGGRSQRQLYKEVTIAHEHMWLKNHWQSLCSNYRSSPYFEYYESEFEAIFTKEYDKLFDWNRELFHLINDLLELNLKVHYTTSFEKHPESCTDSRSLFMPNKEVVLPDEMKYTQVFESKTGFIPNLSIVDLLFAEGPNAISFLR